MVYNKKYHSVFTCTLGANQSGKTDFELMKMIRLNDLGLYKHFGINIPDLDLPFKYDFIEDYPALQRRCEMLNPNPKVRGIKRYLMYIDEFAKLVPQDQPWLNVKMISNLQTVRKYGLNLLASGIDRVDKRVLNEKHFHGYFLKAGKKRQDRAIYFDWFNNRKIKLFDIPKVSIPFDTWYSASFYMEAQANITDVILNPDHEIVKAYLDADGSWKRANVHSGAGHRAVLRVLQHYFTHYLSKDPALQKKEVAQAPEVPS